MNNPARTMLRTGVLTTTAMIAFAANSVLARLALANDSTPAMAYAGIRVVSAAIFLAAVLLWRARRQPGHSTWRPWPHFGGSWAGAASFALYVVTFSAAYVMVQTAPGALILFGSTQLAMLGWAMLRGERPGSLVWLGMALALAALIYLLLPSLVAPPLAGAALMAVAGAAWGAYSLIGRASHSPLADTAGNFLRCAPVGILLIAIGLAQHRPSPAGVIYGVLSGAIASALGYIVWYGVLPSLTRTSASLVQLTVPALAALGGVLFIAEPLTPRLLLATAGMMGGVALALLAGSRPASLAVEP